jgi:hypothetical protein
MRPGRRFAVRLPANGLRIGRLGSTGAQQAEASLKAMEVQQREGSLLPVDAAVTIVAKVFGLIKQRLLSLPARLTPRVFRARAEAEMQQVLKREMVSVLVAADAMIEDASSKLRSSGQPRTNGDAQEDRAKAG